MDICTLSAAAPPGHHAHMWLNGQQTFLLLNSTATGIRSQSQSYRERTHERYAVLSAARQRGQHMRVQRNHAQPRLCCIGVHGTRGVLKHSSAAQAL
eukprot:349967-Chlamydomonas_euryale.AAC.3